MIRFENVSKSFKNNEVLKNLSFTVDKGDFVCLIGASGCGKTTTLKMINRLINPTSGKIFINGADISQVDIIKLRRKMGYVIQQTGLFPHMTVKENIELIAKLEKRPADEIFKRTAELMEMIGLNSSFMDRFPIELSGGQQQRVGVARAFALDPDIILMDEPFSAVDPITRANLQDELAYLQSDIHKTVVFVTHDMNEAIKLASKICIMDKGSIVQYDTPENILKNPANELVQEFVGKNRIWNSPEFIKAEDIMLPDPVKSRGNITVFSGLQLMRANKIDNLMIVDPRTNALEGVIRSGTALMMNDKSQPIENVMNRDYEYVGRDASIIDILKLVDEKGISCIPVIDDNKTLLGLITKSSLLNTLSSQYIPD